eukprot:TRINITY_DN374_c0_g2_i3.p1 TRINITY_DN374_c0_g2~~TRINITY_DN374_c0_g2_i3.p1  ORF type:complete len:371 (-),score=90.67 TRINITY_DN374_c0_g2_i3:107-1195(-)
MSEDLRKGFFFIALAALQFGLQPFFVRWFAQDCITSIIVLASEIAKIIICTAILYHSGDLLPVIRTWTFWNSVKTAGIPATLYAIINILYQISYKNLDAVLFNFLNQTKLFWCSVFLWVFLKKPQSEEQIVALVMLTTAAVMLTWGQFSESSAEAAPAAGGLEEGGAAAVAGEVAKRWASSWMDDPPGGHSKNSFLFGFVPVLTGSILSGVATTVSQKVLQNDNKNSYLYTAELGLWGILTLLLFSFGELGSILEHGILKGWTVLTLLPIVTSACGGIVIGLVVKYAGGVRKGFGTVAGMMLTAVLGFFLDAAPFTITTWIALPLLVASVYIHTTYPYKPPGAAKPPVVVEEKMEVVVDDKK